MQQDEKLEKNDSIWYPFTQMSDHEDDGPLIITNAKGNKLFDAKGVGYIDAISSLWTNVHGHRHPKLDQAIKDQLDKVSHTTLLGSSNDVAIKLSNALVEITPKGLEKVFFSDSGSTAVEIALKIAYQMNRQSDLSSKQKKNRFISFSNAYHGDTVGSISVGGIDIFHKTYKNLLFDSIKIPSPHCYRCPYEQSPDNCQRECILNLENIIEKHADETCALVIEPLVQGAAGILTHPSGYLAEIRRLCTKYEIIMIADEVAVGFGKTGTMFACEQENISPDIMALAKGISGGYLPLAATLVTEKIFNSFLARYDEFKTFFHGHTYTGNALACAVSLANIEIFKEESVIENLSPKIERLTKHLKKFSDLKHVGDVRQCGIMVGIELVKDKRTKESFESNLRIGNKVIMEARKLGIMLRPLSDVIVFMPPLSITIDEIDKICEVTYESIKKITNEY